MAASRRVWTLSWSTMAGSNSYLPHSWHGRFVGQLWDVRLGWNSPVKEVVHPQYINLQSRNAARLA